MPVERPEQRARAGAREPCRRRRRRRAADAEQAARIKEHIQSGELPLFFGAPHRGGSVPGFGPAHHHGLDSAAEYLGLTEEQLRAQLRPKVRMLAQVAQAQRKSVEGLVDALVADFKTHLDAAVKAGRVTQAKADEILAGRPRARHRARQRRAETGLPAENSAFFAPPPVGAPA